MIIARRCSLVAAIIAAAALVGFGRANAQNAYVLGYITDLSGPLADSYTPTWEGFELYMKALNDRGGINGHKVEVVIITVDGMTDPQAVLTEREVKTIEAVDTLLRAEAQFTTSYPAARLVRVESIRGVNEHRQERYCLRYRHAGGMAEFWGHVAKTPTFDFKEGVVGVPMPRTSS